MLSDFEDWLRSIRDADVFPRHAEACWRHLDVEIFVVLVADVRVVDSIARSVHEGDAPDLDYRRLASVSNTVRECQAKGKKTLRLHLAAFLARNS